MLGVGADVQTLALVSLCAIAARLVFDVRGGRPRAVFFFVEGTYGYLDPH